LGPIGRRRDRLRANVHHISPRTGRNRRVGREQRERQRTSFLRARPLSLANGRQGPGGSPMSPRSVFLSLAVLVCIVAADVALAQSAPTTERKSLNETSRERRKALEDAQAAEQSKRQAWDERTREAIETRSRKRAECRQQAKEQGLHWIKRVRFMRKCMGG